VQHTLPNLPYAYTDFEPYIDARTMEIHHTKHHATYIKNLNDLMDQNLELTDLSLENLISTPDSLPENIRQKVINNGGGVYNHNFFWEILSPAKQELADGTLKNTIENKFSTIADFKLKFSDIALKQFGSGWAWLVVKPNGDLDCYSTANQDTPLIKGDKPILNLDVWEHAYYLSYQNKRAEYIENWWNVVNWPKVEELFNS